MQISDLIQIGLLIVTGLGTFLVYINFSAQTAIFSKQLELMNLETFRLKTEMFPNFGNIKIHQFAYSTGDMIFTGDYNLRISNLSLHGKAYNIEITAGESIIFNNYTTDAKIDCEPQSDIRLDFELKYAVNHDHIDNIVLTYRDLSGKIFNQTITVLFKHNRSIDCFISPVSEI